MTDIQVRWWEELFHRLLIIASQIIHSLFYAGIPHINQVNIFAIIGYHTATKEKPDLFPA